MRILILLIASLTIFYPAHAQVSVDFTCPDHFAGYLPPRQVVGELSRTAPGTPLNLRPQPTTTLARLDVIPPGVTLDILAGPQCGEGYVWWQVVYNDQSGWVAEGSLNDGEYWLIPRGERVIVQNPDGSAAVFVRTADGFLEPEGCMRPPDDYERVQLGYATLNKRTLAMLDHAQRLYEANGGQVVNFRQAISQGSYNVGAVAASFGTHDGGGAVDISVRSVIDRSVLDAEIAPMILALRIAGFAAWLRNTGELYPNSPIHIHAIAIGDAELSPAARDQIDGEFGYLRGYNGLPQEDGEAPIPDRDGEPVICAWMVELGFDDMRGE